MRIDVPALKRLWKQTVWGTLGGMLILSGLIFYFFTQSPRDIEAIRFLLLLLVLMPAGLGVCYLIRRFIDGLA
jgi:hypothetical protein